MYNNVNIIDHISYPTTRIPNSSTPALHVTNNAHGDISGTKRGIIDPLVSKQPEQISDFFCIPAPGCQIQKCPKSNMFQLQILGLGGFFKKSRNTIHVVYFRKALGTRTSKMMIPGVKYKNVQNLICLNFKFAGVGWFFLLQKVTEQYSLPHWWSWRRSHLDHVLGPSG